MRERLTKLSPELRGLVERQLRNWELARSQKLPEPSEERPVQEFVTISREAGALGTELARRLGERIGWPVFDRQILQAMAGEDALRQWLYEQIDERDVSWVEQTLQFLIGGKYPPADYTRKLSQTVLTLARGSRAIFLGRAANLILPESQGLRVRVVAPPEKRLDEIARRNGTDPDQAREQLERLDRERREFVLKHFGVDPADPLLYDLVLNLGRVTIDEAVDLLEGMLRCRGVLEAG